ncbi:MAG: PTS sugar transporter subunit IIB [Oscillospiraceae bacterium]|nr:PTS sugar transporter subunit IIB [Oscillospiraceae bacterium]
MSVVFYRIDDRLVHGQIMTAWAKVLDIDRIIVVDDLTAQNSFLAQVMRLSVPDGFEVQVCSGSDGAGAILADGALCRTMVLTKTPEEMEKLLLSGVSPAEVNVGGLGERGGRRGLCRGISVDESELATLKRIAARGVTVYCQSVPDARKVIISEETKL